MKFNFRSDVQFSVTFMGTLWGSTPVFVKILYLCPDLSEICTGYIELKTKNTLFFILFYAFFGLELVCCKLCLGDTQLSEEVPLEFLEKTFCLVFQLLQFLYSYGVDSNPDIRIFL